MLKCCQINEFKQSLQESDDLSDEEVFEDDNIGSREPTIWFGISRQMSKEELLSDIPARQVTDRLVSYYLISKEPIVGKNLNSSISKIVDAKMLQQFSIFLHFKRR